MLLLLPVRNDGRPSEPFYLAFQTSPVNKSLSLSSHRTSLEPSIFFTQPGRSTLRFALNYGDSTGDPRAVIELRSDVGLVSSGLDEQPWP
ncbi:uncharacterized protein MYCGRDRAFT_106643 [Zymoseptoria tritici IPO323]|uniref:Uncharacterized protein n=1 Tax=Zymoseptoria tritici (strain CBS 115943 / IPO323) TaxID=336722 RepID=F9XRG7_ZYMTI|nr:uncharacterized protein MYCGRDRAFT_106643 [Zymoseptoria tritici IPO323]EGP82133.1 hypothetical protein MYCGRDRAFT_106643 [Zymoseptoria tritici IPO323]